MRAHLEVEHCECIEGGLEVQIGSSKSLSVSKLDGLTGPQPRERNVAIWLRSGDSQRTALITAPWPGRFFLEGQRFALLYSSCLSVFLLT